MNAGTICCLLLLLTVILINESNKRATVTRIIRHRIRKKGAKTKMTELAKQFIGKECIIYTFTFNTQLEGTIKDVIDGALLLEKNGTLEAVNLDFITRIREYPRKKNGKKKSIVID